MGEVIKCKKCGKELFDAKQKYCPLCKAKKDEKKGKILKFGAGAFATAGSFVLMAVTKGKFGGKKG